MQEVFGKKLDAADKESAWDPSRLWAPLGRFESVASGRGQRLTVLWWGRRVRKQRPSLLGHVVSCVRQSGDRRSGSRGVGWGSVCQGDVLEKQA